MTKEKELQKIINNLDPTTRDYITPDDLDFLKQYKDIRKGLSNLLEVVEQRIFYSEYYS